MVEKLLPVRQRHLQVAVASLNYWVKSYRPQKALPAVQERGLELTGNNHCRFNLVHILLKQHSYTVKYSYNP
jgi:hypothetical protein